MWAADLSEGRENREHALSSAGSACHQCQAPMPEAPAGASMHCGQRRPAPVAPPHTQGTPRTGPAMGREQRKHLPAAPPARTSMHRPPPAGHGGRTHPGGCSLSLPNLPASHGPALTQGLRPSPHPGSYEGHPKQPQPAPEGRDMGGEGRWGPGMRPAQQGQAERSQLMGWKVGRLLK